MLDSWFVWALVGIACIGLEMLIPGFVIFFFGLGGLSTALFSLIPGVQDLVWLQIVFFIVISVLSLVFLRKHFSRIFVGTVFYTPTRSLSTDPAGTLVEVIETVSPLKEGRVRYNGTTWKARSHTKTLEAGSMARIVVQEGLTIIIEAADVQDGSTGGN